MGGGSEQEVRRRIDRGGNVPLYLTALRFGPLTLRDLLLTLRLLLLGFGTGLAPDLLGGNRGTRPEGRKCNHDDQFPLHSAEVTTPRLNRK